MDDQLNWTLYTKRDEFSYRVDISHTASVKISIAHTPSTVQNLLRQSNLNMRKYGRNTMRANEDCLYSINSS